MIIHCIGILGLLACSGVSLYISIRVSRIAGIVMLVGFVFALPFVFVELSSAFAEPYFEFPESYFDCLQTSGDVLSCSPLWFKIPFYLSRMAMFIVAIGLLVLVRHLTSQGSKGASRRDGRTAAAPA